MRHFLVIVIITLLVIQLVCSDENIKDSSVGEKSVETIENSNSVKTKRGIYGLMNGLSYSIPTYHSHGYPRYTPYARFPGIHKSPITPITPTYALTPGNAVVHSFYANYPKVFLPKPELRPPPVLFHTKPILPAPSVYANAVYPSRFPFFVPKPAIIPKPIVPIPTVTQFATPEFVPSISPQFHTVNPHIHTISPQIHPINPHIHTINPQIHSINPHIHTINPEMHPINPQIHPINPHIHTINPQIHPINPQIHPINPHIHTINPIGVPNIIPQSTFVSQDGSLPSGQPTHINRPAVTVLPPFTPSQTQTPNNYYLPPESSALHSAGSHSNSNGFPHSNDQYHYELQTHLQQLKQVREFQQHQDFLRSEQDIVTPLSEQGYETASNNGRYSGPSSYEVELSSRG